MAVLARFLVLASVFFIALSPPLLAQTDTSLQDRIRTAWQNAMKVAVRGPAPIALADQATLNLTDAYMFVPKAEATALMLAMGNSAGSGFLGLVVPKDESQYWFLTVDHTADGYVSDDEAREWNADDLLQSLIDGSVEQNKEREKIGVPALEIIGWIEPPHYDAATHKLIWSLRAKDHGAPADAAATVNYNTYALGRDGFFELNLVTSEDVIDKEKEYARQLLAALEYKSGKRYEDFNANTDRIAEYGIAALIGGIAAKKLGLLAVIGVFFAKFAKLILVGFAVAGGAIIKFFRRGSGES